MMTPPVQCESLPDDPLTKVKLNFIAAAHAASPLRAVEKSPFVAVSFTAATTMAATIIAGGSFFGKVGGGLFTQGLGLAATILRSRLAQPITQGVSQGVSQSVAAATSPQSQA